MIASNLTCVIAPNSADAASEQPKVRAKAWRYSPWPSAISTLSSSKFVAAYFTALSSFLAKVWLWQPIVPEVMPNVGGTKEFVVPRVVVPRNVRLFVTCQPIPQESEPSFGETGLPEVTARASSCAADATAAALVSFLGAENATLLATERATAKMKNFFIGFSLCFQ